MLLKHEGKIKTKVQIFCGVFAFVLLTGCASSISNSSETEVSSSKDITTTSTTTSTSTSISSTIIDTDAIDFPFEADWKQCEPDMHISEHGREIASNTYWTNIDEHSVIYNNNADVCVNDALPKSFVIGYPWKESYSCIYDEDITEVPKGVILTDAKLTESEFKDFLYANLKFTVPEGYGDYSIVNIEAISLDESGKVIDTLKMRRTIVARYGEIEVPLYDTFNFDAFEILKGNIKLSAFITNDENASKLASAIHDNSTDNRLAMNRLSYYGTDSHDTETLSETVITNITDKKISVLYATRGDELLRDSDLCKEILGPGDSIVAKVELHSEHRDQTIFAIVDEVFDNLNECSSIGLSGTLTADTKKCTMVATYEGKVGVTVPKGTRVSLIQPDIEGAAYYCIVPSALGKGTVNGIITEDDEGLFDSKIRYTTEDIHLEPGDTIIYEEYFSGEEDRPGIRIKDLDKYKSSKALLQFSAVKDKDGTQQFFVYDT